MPTESLYQWEYNVSNGRIAQLNTTSLMTDIVPLWDYFLPDALGSVRQLTDTSGAVTYARAYDPYGVATATSGASQTPYGYTGEYTSNDLVYLRARHYDPGMGRFLTRDTWMGDYNRPLSLNQWMYVEGNPVNLTDPSGLCAKGKCGPDLTDWFVGQMKDHYQYGVKIRMERDRMKLRALLPFMYDCSVSTLLFPPFLFPIASEAPFREIVSQVKIPRTKVPIGVGLDLFLSSQITAGPAIEALGMLEYALYGLAVDYSNVKYPFAEPQCSTSGCGEYGGHRVITICDKCIDASDLGNLMFGLGGAARGYPLSFTYPSATLFNVIQDHGFNTMFGPDGRGAAVGWFLGTTQTFGNRGTFCSVVNSSGFVGWNENSDAINSQCAACSVTPLNGPNTKPANSLYTISPDNPSYRSTIEWLFTDMLHLQ